MLKIKLFAIAAFLAFVSCAFLFSGGKSQAQSSENVTKRDEILEKVATYKLWQQVQKPEKKADEVLTIDNSALAG
jgi:hypothetical protein